MKLYDKVFFYSFFLQEIIRVETEKIFQPIMEQVELQGEGVLLFPPIQGTTWAEWIVKSPEGLPSNHYRHLLLMLQEGPNEEIILGLTDRYVGKPDNLARLIATEDYRAGRIPISEFELPNSKIQGEPLKDEEWKEDFSIDEGLTILAWQPLKEKINAKAVAERIIAEGRKMQEEQQAIFMEFG